jgi:hypothetical protein
MCLGQVEDAQGEQDHCPAMVLLFSANLVIRVVGARKLVRFRPAQ